MLVQVTDIHVLLYNTMMTCGITPHEMFLTPIEERPRQVPEKVAAPKKVTAPTISKATSGPKKAAESRPPTVKLTPSDRNSSSEEPDSTKTPKRLTQKHMLQWMADRNGVSNLPSPSMGYKLTLFPRPCVGFWSLSKSPFAGYELK